jgi:hypothetical protein
MTRPIQVVAVLWAVVGAAIALLAVSDANADARGVLLIASIALPLCAVMAAVAIEHGRPRLGAVLLFASCATPAYMAQVLAVAPFIAAIVLLTSTARTPKAAAQHAR